VNRRQIRLELSWKKVWIRHATVALAACWALALVGVRVGAQDDTANSANDVLAHLNAAISWYKNINTRISAGTEPSDAVYLNNAQNLAAQVVRLAFQSAQAHADLLSENAVSRPNTGQQSGAAQRYAQMEAEVSQRIDQDQTQIDALKQKPTGKKQDLQAAQESLEGRLELDKATLTAVQQMRTFAEQNGTGGGLKGSINELARSVPEVMESQVNNKPNPAPGNSKTETKTGLFGALIALYGEVQSIHSIELRISESDNVQKIATNLRTPLRNELSNTVNHEKNLANQSGVSKEQYDALTKRFKAITAAMLPLSEELLVLDQSKSNLLQWRTAHINESRSMLLSILTRVFLILFAIGLVLGLAEVWQRLTFRYIHEPRRRRQFLLLRRVVIGFLICLVVLMGFASEFSSLATFAGFVTAGIAVGLQTILLSVAAYFFVIGRYGISVGDRVSVAGVTGDVMDVGLFRFYVLEFAGTGYDLYPTGRIAVFSNAVLFQATTPLFKQLPGTRYIWHEAAVPLAPTGDYTIVQDALESAIMPVFKEYKLDSLWQRSAYDQTEFPLNPPEPQHRLQFSDSGLELVARYPVALNRASEIDEKITRALIEAIQKNDQVAHAVSGAPKIRAAVKG
jgi:small-conductance mechanosensitive channel